MGFQDLLKSSTSLDFLQSNLTFFVENISYTLFVKAEYLTVCSPCLEWIFKDFEGNESLDYKKVSGKCKVSFSGGKLPSKIFKIDRKFGFPWLENDIQSSPNSLISKNNQICCSSDTKVKYST